MPTPNEPPRPPRDLPRELGEQPIAGLLVELGLRSADLVGASTEQLTHRMVARACKGRRLTAKAQGKVRRALEVATRKSYEHSELFNYAANR